MEHSCLSRDCSNDNSSSTGDSSDWDDVPENDMGDDSSDNIEVACLFCSNSFKTIHDGIKHWRSDHEFDLYTLKYKLNMDCYSYIKMVNYIRSNNPDPKELFNKVVHNQLLWEDDKYLKPFINDDPWLLFDFEDFDLMESGGASYIECFGQSINVENVHHVNSENGRITLSAMHFIELQKKIKDLNALRHEKELLLKDAEETIQKMRQTLSNLVAESKTDVDSNRNSSIRCVSSVSVSEDAQYFNSYSHFGIHHEMLSDKIRTQSYKDAIIQCVSGKKVMDVGCGTGILSMFAASAGAQKVIAIDQSDVAFQAIDIIRENGLDNKITVIKGRLEDTTLPEDCNKFDIIVSEWMGYFLLFEGMLDSIIHARDNHLAPNGVLLPNRCSISLVGFNSPGRHRELIDFWSNVYSYKMTCMKNEVVREASVELVNKDEQITDCCEVFSIDIMKADVDSVNFSSNFNLSVTSDGELTSIVGYFDVFFDLKTTVILSTSPTSTPTHWKQTVFYFKKPVTVKKGEVLPGSIVCQRHKKDVRALTVKIKIKDYKQEFFLH